ncbi:hypothetical protein [Arthrobacter sp. StoSoilB13]|uniref:hypothetical protein n=1 Tax=Arthrobacter sp. StoSoilB13 TaxID=2830993 RepID=UPI001CC383DA|nr:hypothetical protein [Arthrobacter sp. StoSoilB13]BCW49465.1 hypothetical protein StoSoilB13_18070 [Arthrobacter sp. StoSoilB13]
MVLSRRLLFRSGIWEIARPRHPLTTGHVLIRLSDPSTEFTETSAADWLFCHNLLRAALDEVLGAKRFTVMFAHRWHPLGAAVGEPVAESSTPTFHLFARWGSESTTPGRQLALPAHHRVPVPEDILDIVDARIRDSLQLSAANVAKAPTGQAGSAHSATSGVVPVQVPFPRGPLPLGPLPPAPFPRVATIDAARHHSVIEPASGAAAISAVLPAELVAMGSALGALPLTSGLTGFSCVAIEGGDPGEGGSPGEGGNPGSTLRIHAVGRSAAEEANPMVDLFNLPEVSFALL